MKVLVITLLFFGLFGCATRSFTKPRSEVVSETLSKGIKIASAEEERELFYKPESLNRDRVLTLVKARENGSNTDSTYTIGPRDEIEVNVFDVPELNVTVAVRQSGFVSLPLVGAVQASGLTETEFQEELSKRLKDFVKQPQVSVFISNYGSQKVGVLGAVSKPGTYSLKKGENSILELISEAGGVTDKAGSIINFIPAEYSGVAKAVDAESRARLALSGGEIKKGEATGIEMFLDQVLGTAGGVPLDIPVRGGDMLIVPEAGKVTVDGEVEKRGAYELGRQMTLIGALAASGGITLGAKVDEIEVIRDVGPSEKARITVDLEKIAAGELADVRLRNGDIVRVPSDSGRRLRQDTYETITKIINFGVGGSVNLAK